MQFGKIAAHLGKILACLFPVLLSQVEELHLGFADLLLATRNRRPVLRLAGANVGPATLQRKESGQRPEALCEQLLRHYDLLVDQRQLLILSRDHLPEAADLLLDLAHALMKDPFAPRRGSRYGCAGAPVRWR